MSLSVRDLNTFYGSSHVLHGVSLDAASGELVVLLGRNGAGKTTTLGSIMGTLKARTGEVVVDGANVTGLPPHRRLRRGLALVPSGARVFANLTVEENLEVVRSRPVVDGDAWNVARVFELFPKLESLKASLAGRLSGGERQMLAVGRALMANPKAILFDEPSEGLAPVIVRALGDLFEELKSQGLTLVLAEQNHRFALRHADRGFLIEKGHIRHHAPASELIGTDALRRYLGV
ncbi:MAG TPA: ABC transporter ATP-binding protein [Acidimicrobiia bacterium]|nr:ABC transporter ATP-binding protein [Acidimicrobiia bacterium]